jgi:hypothetical protein
MNRRDALAASSTTLALTAGGIDRLMASGEAKLATHKKRCACGGQLKRRTPRTRSRVG